MQFPKAVGRFVSLVIVSSVFSLSAQSAETDQLELSDLEARVSQLESVRITGSYRLNYTVADWDDEQKERGGDFRFNQLNLGAETEKNGVRLSSQYRMYDNGLPSMIHHLYVATAVNENTEVQVGLTKVPFGIQPYESHNDWGDNALFMGMNDDYDTGIKFITKNGDLTWQAAYFASGDAKPTEAQRFSADVVSSADANQQANEEAHQINLHADYVMGGSTLGASVQMTGLYNNLTDSMGNAWAAALHLNGQYGPVGVQLQAARYEYNPVNPDGVSEDSVQLGAFGATYLVAAKANAYVANFAYNLPYKGGIVDFMQVYSDYNLIDKDEASFKDSHIFTVGMMVNTGALYTFFDVNMGKNALFLGNGDYVNALASGDGNNDWQKQFNIQFGYYF